MYSVSLSLLYQIGNCSVETFVSGRLIIGQKIMTPALRSLFELRSKGLFDADIISSGILPSICEALHKFDLLHYFDK